MKRTATPTYVLTMPLVVKPGEDRILIGCMEAGRCLYNATLDEALRRHGLQKQSKAWQHTRTITDKKLRSSEFKRLSKDAGFTPAAIITFARTCKNEAGWKDRLGSNVTQRLAEQVFAVVQQYAFGKRGRPRFKGANRPLHSLEATTNAANIIWKPATGCVSFGNLTLPALLPSSGQDPYLHQADIKPKARTAAPFAISFPAQTRRLRLEVAAQPVSWTRLVAHLVRILSPLLSPAFQHSLCRCAGTSD